MSATRVATDRPRLPALTGLRFFAAIVVVGFHVTIDGPVGGTVGRAMRAVFQQGPVGVSFFFVLSGFVLAWSARPDDPRPSFWRRRMARIVPSHLVCWVVALIAAILFSDPPGLGAALASLTLLQAWSPDPSVHYAVNAVSWSLSCELVFYLLFPWVLPMVWRGPMRRTVILLGVVLAGALAIPALAPLAEPATTYWLVYLFPLARLLEFVAGVAVARVVAEGHWPAWRTGVVAAATAAAYVASIHAPLSFKPVAVTLLPLVALVATVARSEAAGERSWLSRPTLVRLGEISFALYLVHQIVLRGAGRALDPVVAPVPALLVVVVLLGASMVAAWLLHAWVENPCVARLSRRRPKPVAVALVDGSSA